MWEILNENFSGFLTLAGVIVTAFYGPKALAKFQGKQKIAEIQTEGDSRAEELYVTHVEKTLDRYEKQMLQMEKDYNRRLAEVEERFNQRMDSLKKEMEQKREKERIYYVAEIEKRDDRIEELEAENVELKERISYLKGES